IQTPVGGVVKEVLVEEGTPVKKGQLLVKMDPKSAQSELVQRTKQLDELKKINRFYQQEMSGQKNVALEAEINPILTRTTQDRRELMQENQVLAAMLDPSVDASQFSPTERIRIQERRQLAQSNAKDPLFDFNKAEDRERQFQAQLDQIQAQQRENLSLQANQEQRIGSAEATFEFEKATFADISEAFEKGAIAGLQFKRQQDTVQQAESELMTRKSELSQIKEQFQRLADQKREIQERIAENRRDRDQAVNRGDIGRSSNNSDLLNQIATNKQRVAEIEANLTKTMRENEQRMADLNNSISQARLTLQYQELRSPVNGVVFDLQAGDNSVANASEPLLKVVPAENLEAKLFVTDRDIGFLQNNYLVRQENNETLPVDIRIDSFPYSEYGDVKGKIAWIGSDALAPTEERPFRHFPIKVKLDTQKLSVRQSDAKLSLQSGMSISASIKVRDRPIISLITDRFTQQIDRLKYLR
ncbi:MAG: HlyD family efflux transporter periplasmic adaptor subunit, partial [Cyanobacteria bacterium P01_F01_bin.42]